MSKEGGVGRETGNPRTRLSTVENKRMITKREVAGKGGLNKVMGIKEGTCMSTR